MTSHMQATQYAITTAEGNTDNKFAQLLATFATHMTAITNRPMDMVTPAQVPAIEHGETSIGSNGSSSQLPQLMESGGYGPAARNTSRTTAAPYESKSEAKEKAENKEDEEAADIGGPDDKS